jgi:hypothetical protein
LRKEKAGCYYRLPRAFLRPAQYFLILSETALRAAGLIFLRRRRFPAYDLVALVPIAEFQSLGLDGLFLG